MTSKMIFTLIVSALFAQVAFVNSKHVETDQIAQLKISLEQLTQEGEIIKLKLYEDIFATLNTKATDDEVLLHSQQKMDCLVEMSPDVGVFIDDIEEKFWGCVNTAGEFVIDAIQKVMNTREELKELLGVVKGLILKCKEDSSDSTAALQCLLDENLIVQEKMEDLGQRAAAFIQSARDAIAEGRDCLESLTEESTDKYLALMERARACYED